MAWHCTLPYMASSPCCRRKTWPVVRAAAVPVLAAMTPQRKAAIVFADMPASSRLFSRWTISLTLGPWQPLQTGLAGCPLRKGVIIGRMLRVVALLGSLAIVLALPATASEAAAA